MNVTHSSSQICLQLAHLIKQLTDDQYQYVLEVLSGSTIGQHTRHIIEFYNCLLSQKNKNYVCYDERERNLELETSVHSAVVALNKISNDINLLTEDMPLVLKGEFSGEMNDFPSSLSRELLYTLEHAVHHMAIIKIAFLTYLPSIEIPKSFGIAESTIKYREQQCVQ